MAQTPASNHFDGKEDSMNYTPSGALTAGDIVVVGDCVFMANRDIAAGVVGSVKHSGAITVPKITGAITAGALVYWDPAGDPIGGTAGSGAATATAGALKRIGYAIAAAGNSAATVNVLISRP